MKISLAAAVLLIGSGSDASAQEIIRIARKLDDSTRLRVQATLAGCEQRWEARQGKAYEFTVTGRASIASHWEARYVVDASGHSHQAHYDGTGDDFPWDPQVEKKDPLLTMTALFSRARAAIGEDELLFRCDARLGFLDSLRISSPAVEDLWWAVGVRGVKVKREPHRGRAAGDHQLPATSHRPSH